MERLRERLGPNATRVAAASGLVLFAVIAALLLSGSGGTYKMKAEFDDVRGLIPGGAVRVGAVNVGAVEKVQLEGDKPVATLRIEDDYVLHEGATADITLFSNAGAVNRTVELTAGDPSKPRIPEGSTLKGEQTDQPVNFDDAAETLDPPTRTNIKKFLIGIDAALKGRGKDFDRTLRHSSAATNEAANLLAQVNSDGLALKTLVAQGSKVTSALAASPADLAAAADRTASLLTVTARREAEISRSIQLLGPALARSRVALASLADAAPRLRRLVTALGPVADELRPFARALPPALSAAGPFITETRLLVRQAPANLRNFAPIITSARKVTPSLGGLIEDVLPLGNALRAYIPDVVGLFQNLGASIGTYDANGHMINLTAHLGLTPPGSSAATERKADDCRAGHLERPYIRAPGALECDPWPAYEQSFIGPEEGRR